MPLPDITINGRKWGEWEPRIIKGNNMDAVMQAISTVGFPIFIAVYVLMRLEPTINKLNSTITQQTLLIAKLSGIDYNEAMRGFKGGE